MIREWTNGPPGWYILKMAFSGKGMREINNDEIRMILLRSSSFGGLGNEETTLCCQLATAYIMTNDESRPAGEVSTFGLLNYFGFRHSGFVIYSICAQKMEENRIV